MPRLLSFLAGACVAFVFFECGAPPCPSSAPTGDKSCEDEGQVCRYDNGCGSPQAYVCKAGAWSYDGLYDCNEPPDGHDAGLDGAAEGGDAAAADAAADATPE